MKKILTTSAILAVSITASHAVVVWTGATSADPFDDTNWDLSGSAQTAVDFNANIEDNVTISGGTITIPNEAGQVRLQIGNGFTMNIDNSVLALVGGGNDGVGGQAVGFTGANINLTNGTTFNPFFITNGIALDIDATSSATFGGGGSPINNSTVNLTAGATLAFTNETVAAFNAEHLSKITVDGAAAVEGVNIMIAPLAATPGSIITVIPEPSGIALLGLAGVALIFRRRK